MLGYLNNPTATAEAIAPGGWTRSGDVGYVKDSKWYVPDRKKDVIKVKGWQVSPTELEGVLLLHDDIIDAGVIGIQAANTYDGVPRGFVVRRPGSIITEDDIKVWMKERLVRYKQMDRVIFVTDIPRNPTGKILRRLLQEGIYTEEVTTVSEQIAASEAAIEKVLVTENGISNSAAIDEHVAAPEAIAVEVLVTENGNSSPAAIYEYVAVPDPVYRKVLVTENRNSGSSPAAAYEYVALPETVYQKVLVTDNGNPGPAAVYEYIAVLETVYQKVLITENGLSSSAATGEQIAALEAIVHKAPVTGNWLSNSMTDCGHIAASEAIAQKVISVENGPPSPAASCEHTDLPEAAVEEVLVFENGVSNSVSLGEDRSAVPS